MQCLFMEKLHYYNESLKILDELSLLTKKPTLLMHACCAPCSCFPLTFLCPHFNVTIFYNNSNIYPTAEYERRRDELKKFLEEFERDYHYHVDLIIPPYDEESYAQKLRPLAHLKEGTERCFYCYRLRMEEAYDYAERNGFDFFTTVMTISSQKNSLKLNEIGEELEKNHPHCRYFYSDFKKKKGADKGREIRNFYQLYQQQYCGCRYSFAEYKERIRMKENAEKAENKEIN